MLLGDVLRTTAARAPDKRALVFGTEALTYRDLDQQSDRITAALHRAGVGQGDRVGLLFGNRPELILCYFACFKLGAIAVTTRAPRSPMRSAMPAPGRWWPKPTSSPR